MLAKQHDRVSATMDALIQNIGFIRECDVLPAEWAALDFARAFLAARKGPGREDAEAQEARAV